MKKIDNVIVSWKHNIRKKETKCTVVVSPSGAILGIGMAKLSIKDKYDKKIGRDISFKRAMQGMVKINMNRKTRTKIWNEFKNSVKTKFNES